MSNYIENQAGSLGESINEKILDAIIEVMEKEISLSKIIEKENQTLKDEADKMNKDLYEKAGISEEEIESLEKINPKQYTSKIEYANFGFQKLLDNGKTIMHDIDKDGNLTVKMYNLESEVTKKLKVSYTVTIK